MAAGSGMLITLFYKNLPLYHPALEMYRKGETTGSNKANRRLSEGHLEIEPPLSRGEEELLFDPQTSGGLLLSVPETQATALLNALRGSGVQTAVKIGEVESSASPRIRVV
jgi:selenide,water dikinase